MSCWIDKTHNYILVAKNLGTAALLRDYTHSSVV